MREEGPRKSTLRPRKAPSRADPRTGRPVEARQTTAPHVYIQGSGSMNHGLPGTEPRNTSEKKKCVGTENLSQETGGVRNKLGHLDLCCCGGNHILLRSMWDFLLCLSFLLLAFLFFFSFFFRMREYIRCVSMVKPRRETGARSLFLSLLLHLERFHGRAVG